MKPLMLIEETPIFQDQESILLMESSDPNSKYYKFSAILQTCDEVNNNRRVYPSNLLSEQIYGLRGIAKESRLLGELDHPFVASKDPAVIMRRQHIVMYERVSHKINDIYMEGNKVVGHLETLRTDKGKTLAGLIESGIKVGFSLRAFGNLKPRSGGVFEVTKPFMIITWDAVSNPSHTQARLVEITENTIKETIYQGALMEGVAVNRIDALIDLVEDYEFLYHRDLLNLINRHFDILYEIVGK